MTIVLMRRAISPPFDHRCRTNVPGHVWFPRKPTPGDNPRPRQFGVNGCGGCPLPMASNRPMRTLLDQIQTCFPVRDRPGGNRLSENRIQICARRKSGKSDVNRAVSRTLPTYVLSHCGACRQRTHGPGMSLVSQHSPTYKQILHESIGNIPRPTAEAISCATKRDGCNSVHG